MSTDTDTTAAPCAALGTALVRRHVTAVAARLEPVKKSAAKYAQRSNANHRLLQETFALTGFAQDYLENAPQLWALLHGKMDDYVQDSLPQLQTHGGALSRQFAEYVVHIHSAIETQATPLLHLASADGTAADGKPVDARRARLQDQCAEATFQAFSPAIVQAALQRAVAQQLEQFYSRYLQLMLDTVAASFAERLDQFQKLLSDDRSAAAAPHVDLPVGSGVSRVLKELYAALRPITVASDSTVDRVHSPGHALSASTSLPSVLGPSLSLANVAAASSAGRPVAPAAATTSVNPLNASGTHILPRRAGSIPAAVPLATPVATVAGPAPIFEAPPGSDNVGPAPALPPKPQGSIASLHAGAPGRSVPLAEIGASAISISSDAIATAGGAGKRLNSATKSRPTNRKGRRPGASGAGAAGADDTAGDASPDSPSAAEVLDLTDAAVVARLPRAHSFESAASSTRSSIDAGSNDENGGARRRPITLAAGGAMAALAGIMSQGLRARNANGSSEAVDSGSSATPAANATAAAPAVVVAPPVAPVATAAPEKPTRPTTATRPTNSQPSLAPGGFHTPSASMNLPPGALAAAASQAEPPRTALRPLTMAGGGNQPRTAAPSGSSAPAAAPAVRVASGSETPVSSPSSGGARPGAAPASGAVPAKAAAPASTAVSQGVAKSAAGSAPQSPVRRPATATAAATTAKPSVTATPPVTSPTAETAKEAPGKTWTSDMDAVVRGRAQSQSRRRNSSASGSPGALNSPTAALDQSATRLDLKKKVGSISGNDAAAEKQATAWFQRHLAATRKTVENPLDQLTDGLLLIQVVERLIPGSFQKYNKRPILPAQRLDNINLLLTVLKENGVQVLCDADDVLRGDRSRSLSLVLAIMRRFP